MEGYLWLLLQTLPLLAAAAVVFFILGWRWRAQDSRRETQAQSQLLDAENIAAESARKERDETKNLEEKLRQTLAQNQAELKESQDQHSLLQKEVLRLSDELKQAQQAVTTPPSAESPEASAKLLQELQQALAQSRQELETERATFEIARQQWQAQQAPVPPKTRPAKTSSADKAPTKPKKPRGKKTDPAPGQ
ncbi:MAG: hypothetical protein V4672_22500 [Verrucomicrobiota bacterium]